MDNVLKVRLPEELKSVLQARADLEGRTLSNLIRLLLVQAVKDGK